MSLPLTITSRSQGQIFGAKPSMEEFERQLAADPTYKAYNRFCTILAAFVINAQALRRTTAKVSFAFQRHHPAH